MTHVTSRSSQPISGLRLTGALRRPGDVVTKVAAIDQDQPSLAVTYSVVRDSVESWAFDVSAATGVVTLASNTSLLSMP